MSRAAATRRTRAQETFVLIAQLADAADRALQRIDDAYDGLSPRDQRKVDGYFVRWFAGAPGSALARGTR